LKPPAFQEYKESFGEGKNIVREILEFLRRVATMGERLEETFGTS
jgi:hypothetical protein